MFKKILPFFFFFAAGCNSEIIDFSDTKSNDKQIWIKQDAKSFVYYNSNDSSKRNVSFVVYFSQIDSIDNMLVNITEKTPLGNFSYPLSLRIKDTQGAVLIKKKKHLYELEVPLKQSLKLAKGKYEFIVTHAMPYTEVHNVPHISCTIKQAK